MICCQLLIKYSLFRGLYCGALFNTLELLKPRNASNYLIEESLLVYKPFNPIFPSKIFTNNQSRICVEPIPGKVFYFGCLLMVMPNT